MDKQDCTPQTYTDMQTEFARLAKAEAEIVLELRHFLGRAYKLKVIGDCETGPGAKVTHA